MPSLFRSRPAIAVPVADLPLTASEHRPDADTGLWSLPSKVGGGLFRAMISIQAKKRVWLGLVLLAGGMASVVAAPVAAQSPVGAYAEDPGNALSRHLKTLATSPRSISALTGAGEAALELGDAQAAATFYARAEEIAPRDGRIKAGLGSALLAMEQVQAALKFFEDARALGAPEGEFAADRGLAHDLLGNPAQAQRDYELAMRTNDTAEVRRRLALSKAISGDRAGALAMIDEQLRRQDRSAWRVRAFILALTGDAQGATEAVRAVMPAQAEAMQPFLARLPLLRPADRALAVHFGHFPSDLGSLQVAQSPQSYRGVSGPATQAVRPTPVPGPVASASRSRATPANPTAAASRQSTPSRDSGPTWAEERDMLRGSGRIGRRSVAQPAPANQQRIEPQARVSSVETRAPAAQVSASARPIQGPPAAAAEMPIALAANVISSSPPAGTVPSVSSPAVGPATTVPLATPNIVEVTPPPSSLSSEVPVPEVAEVQPAAAVTGLASIGAVVRALADDAPVSEAPKPAAKLAKAEAKPSAKKPVATKAVVAAEAKAPVRYWVQIASAPDARAAAEYKRLKGKSPQLLGDTTGWKTANRVLVGPFKNRGEAQALVNKLAKADIAAVQWTSPEGQEIVKLAAK